MAAVSCQELSPLFNQGGLASSVFKFGGREIWFWSESGNIQMDTIRIEGKRRAERVLI